MRSPPAWSDIERDIRIAMTLAADVIRNMIGVNDLNGRGDAAAARFLGLPDLSGISGFIVEETYDSYERRPNTEFLAKIDINGTLFADAARRCYDLVATRAPIEEVNYENDRDEGLSWLWYFLSSVPEDSYGTGTFEYSGLKHDPDSSLRLLHDLTSARLTLAEFIADVTSATACWDEPGRSNCVFTPRDIALLGDVNIRTVRNVMGPKGDKPIRTEAIGGKSRSDLVWGDALDSIEWLSGRRGFQPGPLSSQWVDLRVPEVGSLRALGALPGVVTWINRATSEDLAARLQWSTEKVRNWTRGIDMDANEARAIAAAAGLDGAAYAGRVTALLA